MKCVVPGCGKGAKYMHRNSWADPVMRRCANGHEFADPAPVFKLYGRRTKRGYANALSKLRF